MGPQAMDEPLRANTFNEVRYYLMVTPCRACGKGPWEIDSTETPSPPDQITTVNAHCKHCRTQQSFTFACENEPQPANADTDCINPTGAPSRIIDLGQWLSLFYLLVESAASEGSRPGARQSGYQAALCLTEALKFYRDDELPPESAFFSSATAAAFREHPEKFARQKLQDMRAKLPALNVMARHIERDGRTKRRGWWRFWRQ